MARMTSMRGRLAATAVIVGTLAALLSGKAALAGSFQVNPVNINLPADKATAALTVRNEDDAPLSVGISAFVWTQENGEDVYTPTKDVLTTPPIVTIPAKGSQTVRVGLRQRDASAERTYRVIVEEIPQQIEGKNAVQMVLRLNLPLYALPKTEGKADLHWSAWRDADGGVVVEGRNSGTLHEQVLELNARTASGKNINLSKAMGVVLPGSARQWKIGKPEGLATDTPFQLVTKTAHGENQETLTLEKR